MYIEFSYCGRICDEAKSLAYEIAGNADSEKEAWELVYNLGEPVYIEAICDVGSFREVK